MFSFGSVRLAIKTGATLIGGASSVWLVPATSIQPIGLIANELVTNAAKHGAGKIDVTFRVSIDMNKLVVCDEGNGLGDGFDPHAATAGLGMRVITTLAKQLDGTLQAGPRADGLGACFTVLFPRPR